MPVIESITAREILDSRREPTIEVELTASGAVGVASVPAGASTGSHEALELRDGDASRYGGRGVLRAIANVAEKIVPALVGKEFDQGSLDAVLCALDGTPQKSALGANAILGVSLAFARAFAARQGTELYAYIAALAGRSSFSLPQPAFNVLNGGRHARGGLSVQEFMLVPVAFDSVAQKVEAAQKVVGALEKRLTAAGHSTEPGDEGGFAPKLRDTRDALDLLLAAIADAGYSKGQIPLALDVAANSFYTEGVYMFDGNPRAREELLAWYEQLAAEYPLLSIEDPFAEDDPEAFALLRERLGGRSRTLVAGDDLTVTSAERIGRAAADGAIDAVIIKPNQIGTVTETLAAAAAAREKGLKLFASHRSGETLDAGIADLAVGIGCDYIKAGAPTAPERMAKYNRLIAIEQTNFTA